MFAYKNELRANLDDMSEFWILSKMEFGEKCKTKIMTTAQKNLHLIKFFIYTTPIIIAVYFLEVYNNFQVCFPEFVPDNLKSHFVKITLKLFLFIFAFFNVYFLVIFDTLTVCTIVYLKMQFQMLGYRLEDVVNKLETNKREEIIKCINYHCFLIR